jgi:hypothetical protein
VADRITCRPAGEIPVSGADPVDAEPVAPEPDDPEFADPEPVEPEPVDAESPEPDDPSALGDAAECCSGTAPAAGFRATAPFAPDEPLHPATKPSSIASRPPDNQILLRTIRTPLNAT